jgi:hypothetical protein
MTDERALAHSILYWPHQWPSVGDVLPCKGKPRVVAKVYDDAFVTLPADGSLASRRLWPELYMELWHLYSDEDRRCCTADMFVLPGENTTKESEMENAGKAAAERERGRAKVVSVPITSVVRNAALVARDAGRSHFMLLVPVQDALRNESEAEPTYTHAAALAHDLAEHGLRFDLNPTMQWDTEDELARGFLDYVRRMDLSVRERAAEALGEDAATAQRPRTASMVVDSRELASRRDTEGGGHD